MNQPRPQEDMTGVHVDPAMRPSSPPYYQDLDEEVRFLTPSRRTASWESDDTIVRAGDGLLHDKCDDRSTIDFDLDDDSYTTRPRRKTSWARFGMLCGAILLMFLLTLDICLRISASTRPEDDEKPDAEFCQWGKSGDTQGLSWYPTNFLQDVIPKPLHSHNDYWRKVPLFTALKQGAMGVEADVWLFDEAEPRDTLYVGHEQAALQPNRTFQSLYIQPLVEILERQNPHTEFYHESFRGVFDTQPNQTLVLLVDVKTAGSVTWAKVVEQLEPLRRRDWLTYYANNTVHTRPITVVGTGNTPFADLVANQTYRDYFYDAPLGKLDSTYDATNSFYASVNFGAAIGKTWMGGLGAEQVERIRSQVRQAHNAGLKVRYWDLPSWPVSTRNRVWDALVNEGVDMLNVDDVKAAAKRKWRY